MRFTPLCSNALLVHTCPCMTYVSARRAMRQVLSLGAHLLGIGFACHEPRKSLIIHVECDISILCFFLFQAA